MADTPEITDDEAGAIIRGVVGQLAVGDVFRITNADTPWFAQGQFRVTAIDGNNAKLERVGD